MRKSAILSKFADSFFIEILAPHSLIVIVRVVHHLELDVHRKGLHNKDRDLHLLVYVAQNLHGQSDIWFRFGKIQSK